MGENMLTNFSWIALLIWLILSISDYYLTIYGAKLFHENGASHYDFDGSYELNPDFIDDVDNLRRVSKRFIRRLTLMTLLLASLWVVTVTIEHNTTLFSFFAGVAILVQVPVHITHVNNLVAYSKKNSGSLVGKVFRPRWLVHKLTAVWFLSFSVSFLLLYVLTSSIFILGGVLSCSITGLRSWRMSVGEVKAKR
jgi:hypothetical protein